MRIFEPWNFSVLDVENLRLHYAQHAARLAGPLRGRQRARARRCSTRSSCACGGCTWPVPSAAFTTGTLQLFQVVFAPGENNDVPLDARAPVPALTAGAMRSCEVLIVGGGPAGAAAAWKLRRAGVDVLVLDRERFPRLKLCAGWITPEVVQDLEMDIAAYPHRLLTYPRLRMHFGRWQVPVPCVQHSIRRFEFDAWLLERSGAPLDRAQRAPHRRRRRRLPHRRRVTAAAT